MRIKPYRVFFRQISTAATRLQNGLINPTDSDQFTAPAVPVKQLISLIYLIACPLIPLTANPGFLYRRITRIERINPRNQLSEKSCSSCTSCR